MLAILPGLGTEKETRCLRIKVGYLMPAAVYNNMDDCITKACITNIIALYKSALQP